MSCGFKPLSCAADGVRKVAIECNFVAKAAAYADAFMNNLSWTAAEAAFA